MATTAGFSAPIWVISSEKTLVHEGAEAFSGFPVTGSTIPTAWNFSAISSRAGLYPRPFSVMA